MQPAEAQQWSFALPAGPGSPAYHLIALHAEGGAPVVARLAAGTPAVAQTPGVLCLVDDLEDGTVSVQAAFGLPDDGAEPPTVALQPGTWQSAAVSGPADATLDGGEPVAVRVVSEVAVDLWLAVSEPLSALTPDPLLPLLGGHLQQQRQFEAARLTWKQHAAPRRGTVDAARGLLGEGDALRGLGRVKEALDCYREALAAAAVAGTVFGEPREPVTGYLANRLVADLEGAVRERLTAVLAGDSSAEALASAVACWPPTPEAKAAIVTWLSRLPAEARLDGQAIHYLISVFDASGDRTSTCLSLLPDNQPHLTRVSSPTELAVLTPALRLALQVGARERATQRVPVEALAHSWQVAECQGHAGLAPQAARALQDLAAGCRGTLAEEAALLAAGQWLHFAGHVMAARAGYEEVARRGGPVAWHARLGLAELGLAEGELAEALQGYGAVATGSGDWRLRDWAVFRQAQCLELAGRWAEALEVAEVAAQTDLLETRAEADFARRRLKAAVEQPPPPSREPVQYIGEDRSTGGDWYAYYGSEAFILCAQQAPNDLSGDLSGALEVTPRTGRAEEAVRYWVSRPDDTHRASLYNPVSRVRRAANWDDRGEAYDRGAGPDLCLGITVRASGPHRLSLYFVNDHHFYEPRRAYTVQVSDAEGRYLAGTEVRSFLNGVYKQFAVQGPARFTIRIRRNLSMNVLLSGVFLDGVPPEVPGLPDGCQADDRVTLALSEWRAARARARSSADERAASWRLACRLRERRPPAEVGAFLDAVTEAELEARRFGPAMWAADAHSFLLLNDREALREHLLATVTRFSEPSPVRAPHDASAVLPWPYVEATFAQYLDVGGRGLAGEALVGFYRGTAENFLNEQPILAGLAYRQLAGLVGDRGLTPLDHYLMTFASNEPQADAARLERALAETPGLPNRTALQLQLLGRYVALGDIAKAEALAQQLRAQPDDADAAANAAYNLGLLYLTRRQPDEARVRLAAVLNDFPNTHWAQCAQGYLARLPAPLPP